MKKLPIPKPLDDQNRKQAVMWYYVGWAKRLKDIKLTIIRAIAKELSDISAAIPLHMQLKEFKPQEINTIMKAIGPFKYFRGRDDNQIELKIKGGWFAMTPIKAYALLVFCVNKLSKGQLADKEGYEYIKMADEMIKNEKEN